MILSVNMCSAVFTLLPAQSEFFWHGINVKNKNKQTNLTLQAYKTNFGFSFPTAPATTVEQPDKPFADFNLQ